MKFIGKKTMGLALLAALFVPATTVAGTLTNGDFESPAEGFTHFFNFGALTPDSYATGWVHDGTGFDSYSLGTDYGVTPDSGAYYITFGHNGTTGGTLSQTFDTVIGQQYTVGYMLMIQQQGFPFLQSVGLEAFDAVGASSLGSVQTDFNYAAWTAGTPLSFTAASNSSTITFTDLTTPDFSGALNWDLDTVTVTGAGGTAAPEPASCMLIGGALLGISVCYRRRRSR